MKSLLCCLYTTTPELIRGWRFNRRAVMSALHFPFLNVQWPEVESNHRCRRIRATCFRYNTGPIIEVARIELCYLVLPKHAGHHYPSPRLNQNGRIRTGDLLAPDQADFQAFPRSESNSSSGSRTPSSALKGQHPRPVDERAKSEIPNPKSEIL